MAAPIIPNNVADVSINNLVELESYLESADDHGPRQLYINSLAKLEQHLEDMGNHERYSQWLSHQQENGSSSLSRRNTIDHARDYFMMENREPSSTIQQGFANTTTIAGPFTITTLDATTGDAVELPRVSQLVQDDTAEFYAHHRASRQLTPLIRVDTTISTPGPFDLPKTTPALFDPVDSTMDGHGKTLASPSDSNFVMLSLDGQSSPRYDIYSSSATSSNVDGSSDDQYGLEIEVVIKRVKMESNNDAPRTGLFRVRYVEFENDELLAMASRSSTNQSQNRVLDFEPLFRKFEYGQDSEHDNKGFFLATSGKMEFFDRTWGNIEYLEPTPAGSAQEPVSAEALLEEQDMPLAGFGSGAQGYEKGTNSSKGFKEDGRE